MILGVLVGYILGILPFIVPKFIELIRIAKNNKVATTEAEETKEQAEIFNEWLNGANEPRQVDQHELYEEYITGKVKGA